MVGGPPLTLHREHVLVRPGGQDDGGAPHAIMVGILERNGARAPVVERADHVYGARDRKSTRLNSSHLVISYAVFCLKKKKKAERNILQMNCKRESVPRV